MRACSVRTDSDSLSLSRTLPARVISSPGRPPRCPSRPSLCLRDVTLGVTRVAPPAVSVVSLVLLRYGGLLYLNMFIYSSSIEALYFLCNNGI